jgi:hypothetical protein
MKTNTNNEKKLKKYIEKVHSRGIVYLSRLPPHMVCLHLSVICCQWFRLWETPKLTQNVLLYDHCPATLLVLYLM